MCDGWAEHGSCHIDNSDQEASARAITIEEDEYEANCQQRMHTGGPRHGDLVQVTYRDGRTLQGSWDTSMGRTGQLLADETGHP